MILIDVNVLVYAHREDCERHAEYRGWLERVWASPASFGMADIVLSGCLRVLTHQRIFRPPTPLPRATAYIEQIRNQDNCVIVVPGERHWGIFLDLCARVKARGNLIPDAYLAALAIESGSEWITTDRDFARFPGLRWRHPLQ